MKEGWKYKKLEEVGVVITGNTPSTKDYRNYESEDYCFVKPSDILKDGITKLRQSEYHISDYAYQKSRKLPKGSVLTTCIGIIGKVGILQMDATCNQQINAIVPLPLIDSSYLAYTILSSKNQLDKIANAPVVPIINKKEFSNLVIPVPPLSEQQHIVEELDLLSFIIGKKKAQLNELDNLAQSLFYEMFGDPNLNENNYDIKKLGEVCSIERGGSPRPITDYITDAENGINWIKIGDAVEGSKYIKSTSEKIKPEGMKKSRFVHKGDFILSNSMSFGKPYILGVDGCIHDGWLVIHDEKEVFDKSYLYYYLSSPTIYGEFKRLAVGGVVNNLNSKLVRGVKVVIPPIDLQQQFASKIEAIEHQKELIKQSIKEVETLFNSRMDYYFN